VDSNTDQSRIELHRLTVPDAIVIVLLLSLSVGLIAHAALGSRASSSRPMEACIYHDGKLLKCLSLEGDRQIPLENGKMLIEIKDGKIRVLQSDCPRQVCTRIGWIAHSGEAITCVPFKTVIEISSTGKTSLDAVVF
jgi:hypothetical protein